jgi:hypothetical protein
MKIDWVQFLVTIIAVLVGLVLGKYVSKALASVGVPIAAGNPIPMPLKPAA